MNISETLDQQLKSEQCTYGYCKQWCRQLRPGTVLHTHTHTHIHTHTHTHTH